MTYPFIKFQLQLSPGVIKQPTRLLDLSLNCRIVDSLRISNTTDYNISTDVYIVRQNPDDGILTYSSIVYHKNFYAFQDSEILKDSCLYLQPGDFISVNSSGTKHKVDFLVSYREITANQVIAPVNITLTQNPSSATNDTPQIVTATSSSPHNLASGNQVLITGASPKEYNGFYTVTVTSETKFTYKVPGTFTSSPNITGTPSFTLYKST